MEIIYKHQQRCKRRIKVIAKPIKALSKHEVQRECENMIKNTENQSEKHM